MRDPSLYLQDILSAAESIEAFLGDMTEADFRADDKTASAVIQKLEVIGEATKSIPPEWSQAYPVVPWRDMAGMRDRLIHAYFEVDHGLVWRTIKKRLPEILPHVRRMLVQYRPAPPSPPEQQ